MHARSGLEPSQTEIEPMSMLTSSTRESELGRRARRWAPRALAAIVLGWSAVELIGLLAAQHTVGPEVYGFVVAALGVMAGIATLWLLWSATPRTWLTAAIVLAWGIVALGGIAGTVVHAVGPAATHGEVDTRPRPAGAPLVFTALGALGSGALIYDIRRRGRRQA